MPRLSREKLIALQKEYKTDAKIGSLFGISRQAVHQARIKFGIPSLKEKNTERNHKIHGLYAKGLTGTKIAKEFDISVSQTYRIINRLRNEPTPA